MASRQSITNLCGALLIVGYAVLATGCITTTEGGFTDQASPDRAREERVSLARQYIAEGNWDSAKRNLELAKQIDPDSADVHEAFGLLYQRTGELELAEENFSQSVSLDRNCSRCRNNYAAFLYSQERYKQAEDQLERVVRDTLYSARPQAFVNLGLCRLKLFNDQGAEEAFMRALSMDRTNRIALLELADLRFAAGDITNAQKYYETYRSLVRQQSARGLWLGIRIARQTGDKDAEASYELALSNLFPTSAEYEAFQRTQNGE
jgi:type IV pilus assembly protein PilF